MMVDFFSFFFSMAQGGATVPYQMYEETLGITGDYQLTNGKSCPQFVTNSCHCLIYYNEVSIVSILSSECSIYFFDICLHFVVAGAEFTFADLFSTGIGHVHTYLPN